MGISEFLFNYSLTGENLTREILSYLDFSSIQEGKLVCKVWNHFLSNDWLLSLRMVMRTKPYFEEPWVECQLREFGVKQFAKEYFVFIKKHENLDCIKLFKLFKKIVAMSMIVRPALVPFWGMTMNLAGEEIVAQLFKKIFDEENDPFFVWLRKKISAFENQMAKIRYVKQDSDRWMNTPGWRSFDETSKMALLRSWQLQSQIGEEEIKRIEAAILRGLKKELYLALEN